MALLSLIAVLLIEQIRPLPYRAIVHAPLLRLSALLEERFNAGEHRHGVVAWVIGAGGLILASGAVYALALSFNPILAWVWNVLLLYMTMGFRQFSHFFTDIQLALRMDDLPHARRLLTEWREIPADALSPADVARVSIQEALMASHLHVFGVLLCFLLLPGPCGAVLYRVAAFFADQWGRERGDREADSFGRFARQAFAVVDWLPSRATAAGFAVVGNFEAAMFRWRNRAAGQPSSPLGRGPEIVLSAGTGALSQGLTPSDSAGGEGQPDDIADLDSMQSAVGLVWRALMLWLVLILLMTLARLTQV